MNSVARWPCWHACTSLVPKPACSRTRPRSTG